MVVAPIHIIDWKAVFRKRAKQIRKSAAKKQPDAGQFAAQHFLNTFAPKSPCNIAVYYSVGDELDTWPLTEALIKQGHTVLLPVIDQKNSPLIFRQFLPEAPMVEGAFGIQHPDETAQEAIPDIVVVPLLGIRPDGARLGMGGGFYDRTLNALRDSGEVIAIGLGYAAQKMDRFPVDDHDQFLDGFVSEQGAERIARRR